MMSSLSAEHVAALDSVLIKPASKIVIVCPELTFEEVNSELNLLIEFVKKNNKALGENSFALKLFCSGNTSGKSLNADFIVSCLENDEELIDLQFNLVPINSSSLDLDNASISEASENSVIAVIDCCQYIHLWADGKYLKEIDVFNPKAKPRLGTKFCRPAEDYHLIAYDHFIHHIKYAQETDHWANREKRILRCKPRKTELIFHKSLLNWLEIHGTGFFTFAEVEKLTPDRTDIELVTKNGKKYVLEIKWLGENENGTSYPESRICKGIEQIEEYLKRDKKILIASLLVYNARPETNFKELVSVAVKYGDDWCELKNWDGKDVPTRGTCFIYHLDNRTAST